MNKEFDAATAPPSTFRLVRRICRFGDAWRKCHDFAARFALTPPSFLGDTAEIIVELV